MSQFAKGLFWLYKTVLAMDVDEFLIVDPNTNTTLAEYLASRRQYDSLSALGLDVGQHQKLETTLNPQLPFLSQRQYAHLSSRYTKPIVTNKPLTWGSGMHRIKGRNYRIDPNLYLIHLGMVDISAVWAIKVIKNWSKQGGQVIWIDAMRYLILLQIAPQKTGMNIFLPPEETNNLNVSF